jgi:Ca2+-transporting ATPase
VVYQGILVTVITMASYIIGHCFEVGHFEMPKGVSPDGMTMAFLTMSMCEIFHAFNMRSQHQSVIGMTLKGSHNKLIYASMLFSLVTTAAVIFIPFLANAFGFTAISFTEYLISMGIAVLIIPIVEVVKLIGRMVKKNK